MFKEGRELIKDEHCVRCPTTTRTIAQVAIVKKCLDSDRRVKRELKGHLFDSIKAGQAATTKALISILEIDFQRAFD
jgi:hypothetical protein